MAGWTAWGERAGIRMSLAGDQDWDRALDELEWLVKAPTMDAHHLLDDVFARDLGACWYTNGQGRATRMRLVEVYGRQLPVLLTVREPNLADGLFRDKPADVKVQIGEGLQPPGRGAASSRGTKCILDTFKSPAGCGARPPTNGNTGWSTRRTACASPSGRRCRRSTWTPTPWPTI